MMTIQYSAVPCLTIVKLDGKIFSAAGPYFGQLTSDVLLETRTIYESRRCSKEDINYAISIVENFEFNAEWVESFTYLWAKAVK